MTRTRGKYSPEFKEEAVKAAVEKSRPVADVARELGLVEQTLRNWVGAWRAERAGDEPELSIPERARLRELERETREQCRSVRRLAASGCIGHA